MSPQPSAKIIQRLIEFLDLYLMGDRPQCDCGLCVRARQLKHDVAQDLVDTSGRSGQ